MAHVVSLGIEGLASSCINRKTVDSLDIEGWHMLFLLVLKGWQVVDLTKKPVDSLGIEGWHMLFLLVLKGWQVVVLTKKLLIS